MLLFLELKFGGPLFAQTSSGKSICCASEKVTLSPIVLGLLPPKGFGVHIPVGYLALSLPGPHNQHSRGNQQPSYLTTS
jgi:hypothetical protein